MTLGFGMRSTGVIECVLAFRSAKRQMPDMMRSASAQFFERDFVTGLSQRVLSSNFRRLDFCNSSDFSSLGVGIEDFADYFGNLPVTTSVQIPTASNVFRRLRVNPPRCSEAVGILNYCFHLFVVMCCMFSIMQSPLLLFYHSAGC
jgi:hypothetical protein